MAKKCTVFTKEKKQEFLEAYVCNDFHLTKTCKDVGVSHTSFYTALRVDDEFKKTLDTYKTVAKSLVDSAVLRGINDENPMVVAKYLEIISKSKTFMKLLNMDIVEEKVTEFEGLEAKITLG